MDLRQYVHALRVHWRIVLACLLLGLAVGGALTLSTTPVYAATSSVFLSTSGTSSTESTNLQANSVALNRIPTYADLLTGRNLAQRVINRTGVDMSPGQVASSISTEVIPDSAILDATVTDEDPVRAQLLANAVAAEFVSLVSEIETPTQSTQINPATGETITTTPTAPVKASLVEVATLPGAPAAPSATNNLALGAALGLLLGILLALVRDLLDNTVKTGKQIEEATNAAVLGGVLFDAQIPEHPLMTDYTASSSTGESYRQIRTSLQFVSVDDPPRVLVVTSSISGEGKSTTAVNLALVLAQSGQRVALVEADLRRPRVTRYMRLVSGVGLTNVLVGTAELSEVLQPWRDGKLTVLAAGPHPPNPSELLGSAQMGHVIAELREKNDYVIIDAPPLLPVTDAAVLSVLADGAVIVTRYGSTKREMLRTAADSLRAIDARLIGTVLNMVVLRGAEAFGYGYGYGYGYEADANAPRDLDPRSVKGRRASGRKGVSRGRTTADTDASSAKTTSSSSSSKAASKDATSGPSHAAGAAKPEPGHAGAADAGTSVGSTRATAP